ncbi:MAG TPA: hypothetical protein VKA95_02530 [Nitrososphaeraceae archaeon]|nr:hypothetical protein [Nitrososphaeraceae archaeon]
MSTTTIYSWQQYDEVEANQFDEISSAIGPEVRSIDLADQAHMEIFISTFQNLLRTFSEFTFYHQRKETPLTNYIQLSLGEWKPKKAWKSAQPGTVDRFSGILTKKIPALSALSEEELDTLLDKMRDRE